MNAFLSIFLGVIAGGIAYFILFNYMFVAYKWYTAALPLIIAGFVSMTLINPEGFAFFGDDDMAAGSFFLISGIPAMILELIIVAPLILNNFDDGYYLFSTFGWILFVSFAGLFGGILSLPLRYIITGISD